MRLSSDDADAVIGSKESLGGRKLVAVGQFEMG